MPVCKKCKKETSIWTTDLSSSLCKSCAAEVQAASIAESEKAYQERERARREAELLQNSPLPPRSKPQAPTSPLAILLSRYVGRNIGINHDGATEIKLAKLEQVTNDYISIFVPDKQVITTFPIQYILKVHEANESVVTGIFFKKEYLAVIEVYHLVVYEGATGFSFPLPSTE